MLKCDVSYSGNVEETCECVRALGSKDVEQCHAAVQTRESTFTTQQLPETHEHRTEHSALVLPLKYDA